MSGRAGNNDKKTALDRAILIDEFLIAEGDLCPFCKDLECAGRGEKTGCKEWPAYARKKELT